MTPERAIEAIVTIRHVSQWIPKKDSLELPDSTCTSLTARAQYVSLATVACLTWLSMLASFHQKRCKSWQVVPTIRFRGKVEIVLCQVWISLKEALQELVIVIRGLCITIVVQVSFGEAHPYRLLDENHIHNLVPGICIPNQRSPIESRPEGSILGHKAGQTTTAWPTIGPQKERSGAVILLSLHKPIEELPASFRLAWVMALSFQLSFFTKEWRGMSSLKKANRYGRLVLKTPTKSKPLPKVDLQEGYVVFLITLVCVKLRGGQNLVFYFKQNRFSLMNTIRLVQFWKTKRGGTSLS